MKIIAINTLLASAAVAAPLAYRTTPTMPQTDTQHGVVVADPYRWLENDVRTDPKVAAWIDDYGDPAKPADFNTLYAYSPYHNIKQGDYPAIMVTTADTDDRVVPGHSFKYAAALQAAPLGDKPHLIRIETRAGHGEGKPTDKIIAEAADLWAFAGKWTGLTSDK